jgi:hypothetical protein
VNIAKISAALVAATSLSVLGLGAASASASSCNTTKTIVLHEVAPGGLRFAQLAPLNGVTYANIVKNDPKLAKRYFGKSVPKGVQYSVTKTFTVYVACPTPPRMHVTPPPVNQYPGYLGVQTDTGSPALSISVDHGVVVLAPASGASEFLWVYEGAGPNAAGYNKVAIYAPGGHLTNKVLADKGGVVGLLTVPGITLGLDGGGLVNITSVLPASAIWEAVDGGTGFVWYNVDSARIMSGSPAGITTVPYVAGGPFTSNELFNFIAS